MIYLLNMENSKRERNVNFSQEETDLLVSLVQAKKHIIENKKSDATTWQEKSKAWEDIETAFNDSSGLVYRDHKHLKLKYEAIKRDIKKKSSVIRAERSKSNGDTSTALIYTPTEQKVKQMILSVEGNENSCNSNLVLPYYNKIMLEIGDQDGEPPRKKVSEFLKDGEALQCTPKEKRTSEKLIEEKIEIAKIQKQIITEELEQKVIQRKLLENELEHKRLMHELEKQHLLLKIELLKKELGEK